MKINILTLFPNMFDGFRNESIVKRAIEAGHIKLNIVDIRDYSINKHKQVDDMPFGGGAGMLLRVEPLMDALNALKNGSSKVIYTSPQGRVLTQELVKELAVEDEITIIAGHYEGIDERVITERVDMEVSIGDFVLTGGELPAMVITDALMRMIPGVIKKASIENDSFYNGLLDYPHYTRPAEYKMQVSGDDISSTKILKVPEILLSGHHANIDRWRLKESLRRTMVRRPDLLKGRSYTKLELELLEEIKKEEQ